jgi:hypothetical protein
MGMLGAAVFPVVPGREERVRNFGSEIAEHLAEFERLNREGGKWTQFAVFLQETPMGNLAIITWELEEPENVRVAFADTPFDNWWQDYLRDVLGFDIRSFLADQPMPALPSTIYEWRA